MDNPTVHWWILGEKLVHTVSGSSPMGVSAMSRLYLFAITLLLLLPLLLLLTMLLLVGVDYSSVVLMSCLLYALSVCRTYIQLPQAEQRRGQVHLLFLYLLHILACGCDIKPTGVADGNVSLLRSWCLLSM